MSAATFGAPGFDAITHSGTVGEILAEFPIAGDFFANLNLPALDERQRLVEALTMHEEILLEFGLTPDEIPDELAVFLSAMSRDAVAERTVSSLTILGGRNKLLEDEDITLEIHPGSVISIVGPTGSGKSRLLGDIECLAQRDTPTRRQILIDGRPVDEDDRFRLEGKIVAQLSQNMNFVMDLTVAEFLEMHARSRSISGGEADVVQQCFDCATNLSGEKFTMDTKVTQLSGGQSRALMIADTAYMSRSAIVLIDEIENAGVDRVEAISLLAKREKIVLISTHDPLLALGADKRIIIKNGGISKIIETSPVEKESLIKIERLEHLLRGLRNKIRTGGQIGLSDFEGGM